MKQMNMMLRLNRVVKWSKILEMEAANKTMEVEDDCLHDEADE